MFYLFVVHQEALSFPAEHHSEMPFQKPQLSIYALVDFNYFIIPIMQKRDAPSAWDKSEQFP